MVFKDLANKVMEGNYLGFEEFDSFVKDMRSGKLNDLQFVAFLAALETRNRIKGISAEESSNLIHALRIPSEYNLSNVLCNSGTGGDKIKTINISTPASIIIAAAGINVLKNGSKKITGYSGSKEVLDSFGIQTLREIDLVIEEVRDVGIGYYDFSKLVPVKGRSGLRSPLNLIGPLCNPVSLEYKLLGCVKENYARTIEPVLGKVARNYMILCNPTIDELSSVEPTLILEKKNGFRKEYIFDPNMEDFPIASYENILHPGSIKEGSKIVLDALKGKKGPVRDVISLNAGAGIYLAGKSNTIIEGYNLAQEIISSGQAERKLSEWRRFQKQNEAP